jgi:hypothetical protein
LQLQVHSAVHFAVCAELGRGSTLELGIPRSPHDAALIDSLPSPFLLGAEQLHDSDLFVLVGSDSGGGESMWDAAHHPALSGHVFHRPTLLLPSAHRHRQLDKMGE